MKMPMSNHFKPTDRHFYMIQPNGIIIISFFQMIGSEGLSSCSKVTQPFSGGYFGQTGATAKICCNPSLKDTGHADG